MIVKLLITLLLSANVFALEIFKSSSFTKTLKPSFQSAAFSIDHKSMYDTQIESIFKRIIHAASKSDICKGGEYRIYPSYKYINNERISDGYRSNIRFECEFKDIKKYEKVLDDIKEFGVKILQEKINYKVTEEEKLSAKKLLEKEAFLYAKEYRDSLEEFFSSCTIESIKFDQDQLSQAPYRAMAMESVSFKTTVTSPIEEDINYKLNVDYIFKCKQ